MKKKQNKKQHVGMALIAVLLLMSVYTPNSFEKIACLIRDYLIEVGKK